MDLTDSLSDLEILKDISTLWVVNCKHMTTRHERRFKVPQLELFQWKHELLLFFLNKCCRSEEYVSVEKTFYLPILVPGEAL